MNKAIAYNKKSFLLGINVQRKQNPTEKWLPQRNQVLDELKMVSLNTSKFKLKEI